MDKLSIPVTGDGKTLVTDDARVSDGTLDEIDTRIMAATADGQVVKIESVEQLMELARKASETFARFDQDISQRMTPERAARVRQLRVDQGFTWRAVARASHQDWGDDATWRPESNQLAGMALCKAAAEQLGEDSRSAPWN